MANSERAKSKPHYRMTLEDAISEHKDGIITAKGLIYYAVKTTRADGYKMRIKDVSAFCKQLGINRSTFYRAVSDLKTIRRLEWEAPNDLNLWAPKSGTVVIFPSQKEKVLQSCDTESPICDTESPICDTEPPKSLSDGNSSDPPDLIQIYTDPSHTGTGGKETLSGGSAGNRNEVDQVPESDNSLPQVQNRETPTEHLKDQCSAPHAEPVENVAAQANPSAELRSKPADGNAMLTDSPLPLWRTGPSPDGINPDFVEFIRLWLCTIPPQRDRSRGDAVAYIRNQEGTGDLSVLEARAQDWQRQERRAREQQQQQVGLPVVDLSDVLAEIEVCLKLLGWTVRQAFDYMVEHHDWCGSHPAISNALISGLTDEDLLALRGVLAALQKERG